MTRSTRNEASRRDLGRQLRGSGLLLAGRMLSKVVNLGVQVAIVRLLTKDDFGAFAYGLALVLSGELVVKFGLGRGANRFVPYHFERGERAEVMGTLAVAGATVVGLGAVGFAGLWWAAGQGWAGFPSGDGARVVLILSLLAPVQALDTLCIQALACFSRPRAIFFRKHVLGPGLRALAVAAVFVAGGSSGLLAWAYLGGGVIGLATCLHLTLRELRAHGVLPLPPSQWRVPWRPLLRFSIPLISSDLVFITLSFVTTVVLMRTHGEAAVASMRAVVPAAMLNVLVVQSFSILFVPGAMRTHARGDGPGLREHHWQSAAWATVLSFPVFALTFGVAPDVVPLLLGRAYADSAPLLALLALGHYLGVCLAFSGNTLQVLERTRVLVWIDGLTIALGAGLAWLLCPGLGALGAAVAVTVARVVGSLARFTALLQSGEVAPVPAHHKRIWRRVLAATVAIGVLGWVWQPPLVVQAGVAAALCLVLLRSTARSLDVARSFPELLRVPLFARVVGA